VRQNTFDLKAWNADLVGACEDALGLSLVPDSGTPVLSQVGADRIRRFFEAFSDCRERAIRRLASEPLGPIPGLSVPSPSYLIPDSLKTAEYSGLGVYLGFAPWVGYYDALLLYDLDDDPFECYSELRACGARNEHGQDISDALEHVQRRSVLDICFLGPLLKRGVVLYLPTQRSGNPGGHVVSAGLRPEECATPATDLDPQLKVARLTRGHLLLWDFDDVFALIKAWREFAQRLAMSAPDALMAGRMVALAEVPLALDIESKKLLAIRDMEPLVAWRRALQEFADDGLRNLAAGRPLAEEFMDEATAKFEALGRTISQECHSEMTSGSTQERLCTIYAGFIGALSGSPEVSDVLGRVTDPETAECMKSLGTSLDDGTAVPAKYVSMPLPVEETEG
jgi:hypothetical protein